MSFECENCLGMPEYGCYCDAMGATSAGGPKGEDSMERVRACVRAMAGIPDPVAWMAEIEDVLTRLADYMDRHSDVVDGDYGEPEANKELLLLSAIKPLLSRMGGGE